MMSVVKGAKLIIRPSYWCAHASIKTGFYIPESSSTSKDEIKKKWANPNAQ